MIGHVTLRGNCPSFVNLKERLVSNGFSVITEAGKPSFSVDMFDPEKAFIGWHIADGSDLPEIWHIPLEGKAVREEPETYLFAPTNTHYSTALDYCSQYLKAIGYTLGKTDVEITY